MGDKSAQFQFLIRVAGWPGYFVTRTGGDTSATINKVYDGGSLDPDLVPGRRQTANIVASRNFEVERDNPLIIEYERQVGRWETTLSVQPCDEDLVPTGRARNYPKSRLARLSPPAANVQSDDPSTFEIEFAVRKAA